MNLNKINTYALLSAESYINDELIEDGVLTPEDNEYKTIKKIEGLSNLKVIAKTSSKEYLDENNEPMVGSGIEITVSRILMDSPDGEKKTEFVVSFAGTNDQSDVVSDLTGGILFYDKERANVENFVRSVIIKQIEKESLKNYEITSVGHSLGGAYAELFASSFFLGVNSLEPKNNLYTFNGLGIKSSMQASERESDFVYDGSMISADSIHISMSGDNVSKISEHVSGTHYQVKNSKNLTYEHGIYNLINSLADNPIIEDYETEKYVNAKGVLIFSTAVVNTAINTLSGIDYFSSVGDMFNGEKNENILLKASQDIYNEIQRIGFLSDEKQNDYINNFMSVFLSSVNKDIPSISYHAINVLHQLPEIAKSSSTYESFSSKIISKILMVDSYSDNKKFKDAVNDISSTGLIDSSNGDLIGYLGKDIVEDKIPIMKASSGVVFSREDILRISSSMGFKEEVFYSDVIGDNIIEIINSREKDILDSSVASLDNMTNEIMAITSRIDLMLPPEVSINKDEFLSYMSSNIDEAKKGLISSYESSKGMGFDGADFIISSYNKAIKSVALLLGRLSEKTNSSIYSLWDFYNEDRFNNYASDIAGSISSEISDYASKVNDILSIRQHNAKDDSIKIAIASRMRAVYDIATNAESEVFQKVKERTSILMSELLLSRGKINDIVGGIYKDDSDGVLFNLDKVEAAINDFNTKKQALIKEISSASSEHYYSLASEINSKSNTGILIKNITIDEMDTSGAIGFGHHYEHGADFKGEWFMGNEFNNALINKSYDLLSQEMAASDADAEPTVDYNKQNQDLYAYIEH